MGELVVNIYLTIDGVYQAPGEPDEDLDGGFEHGGWQAPYLDLESGRVMFEQMACLDALLLGRKTYEIFASYWPNAPADVPFTALLNEAPKYVASRTLERADWATTTILREASEDVARLKDEHGETHVSGSGNLVQALLGHDLVDRLNLWIYPVLLGTGKRLFAEGLVPAALQLVDSTTFGTGVVTLSYKRAGKPIYGDTGLDAPGSHWPPEPAPHIV